MREREREREKGKGREGEREKGCQLGVARIVHCCTSNTYTCSWHITSIPG